MSKKKSAKDDTQESAPKKGGMLKIILAMLLVLAAGGGAMFGAMQAGYLGGGGKPHVPNVPQLVLKGEDDPYAPETDDKDAGNFVAGEGGSKYRTAYFSFGDSFTSNLFDSTGLIQLDLAVSTNHDGRVLQWLAKHELAVRSAILVELANTDEQQAYSVEGKAKLQTRLVKAINQVLEENEGFGGVADVHFKSFIVQ